MPRALVVGRFQPFHKGHLLVLEHVYGQGFVPLVVIGSAQTSHTLQNPFTCRERRRMLEAVLGATGHRAQVTELPDLGDPPRWAREALEHLPSFELVFSNDPVTTGAFLGCGVPVRPIPMRERERWQGTRIRELMARGDPAWREAVPAVVVDLLIELGAEGRLAGLAAEAQGSTQRDPGSPIQEGG